MRVLVTGGSGSIGSACVQRLVERGVDTHVVARSRRDDVAGVEWHAADLLAHSAAAAIVREIRPSHLLHLAWVTEHGRYWNDPSNVNWLGATLELFRAFEEQGGRHFVGAGTCAEYDWSEGTLSETKTPLRPTSLYGHCKAAAGNIIMSLAAQSECRAAWGRVFFMYGGNEHPERLIPYIIGRLLKGESVDLTDGNQIRDYIHADDVAEAFVRLLLDSDTSGAVNVGFGHGVSVREIALTLGELTGKGGLLRFGRVARPENDPPSIIGDTTRLANEVGFAPTLGLDKGLDMTLAEWKRRIGP